MRRKLFVFSTKIVPVGKSPETRRLRKIKAILKKI